jgi:azurin
MRSRIALLPFVLFLAVSLVGCGGSDSSSSTEASSSSSTTDTEQTATGDVDRTVTIQPKGNQMKYKQTEFTVAPGATIRLVFENTATSPSMQHNVVVLASTEEGIFQKVGEAGTRAGSTNDYIPQEESLREQILAYTPMSKPGETVEVTFTVPEEPGEYGYVCTFPGHWATMQGTMYVKEEGAA